MNNISLTSLTKTIIVVGLLILSGGIIAIAITTERNACIDTTDAKFDISVERYHTPKWEWKITIIDIRPFNCGKKMDINKISFIITNETDEKMAEWPAPISFNSDWESVPKVCHSPLKSCNLKDDNRNMTLDVGDYIYLTLEENVTGLGWKASVLHDGTFINTVTFYD